MSWDRGRPKGGLLSDFVSLSGESASTDLRCVLVLLNCKSEELWSLLHYCAFLFLGRLSVFAQSLFHPPPPATAPLCIQEVFLDSVGLNHCPALQRSTANRHMWKIVLDSMRKRRTMRYEARGHFLFFRESGKELEPSQGQPEGAFSPPPGGALRTTTPSLSQSKKDQRQDPVKRTV